MNRCESILGFNPKLFCGHIEDSLKKLRKHGAIFRIYFFKISPSSCKKFNIYRKRINRLKTLIEETVKKLMNRCESIYFSVLFCRVPCGTGLFRVAALRLHSFAALRNRKRPLQSLSELNKKRGRRKNS